jgi:hypothetical protein
MANLKCKASAITTDLPTLLPLAQPTSTIMRLDGKLHDSKKKQVLLFSIDMVWQVQEGQHTVSVVECWRGRLWLARMGENGREEPLLLTWLRCRRGELPRTRKRRRQRKARDTKFPGEGNAEHQTVRDLEDDLEGGLGRKFFLRDRDGNYLFSIDAQMLVRGITSAQDIVRCCKTGEAEALYGRLCEKLGREVAMSIDHGEGESAEVGRGVL